MPRVLRPVGQEDRLSVVDHLDELRQRLIVVAVTLVVAFGLAYWQNQTLLNLLNSPLPTPGAAAANHLGGLTNDQVKLRRDLLDASRIIVQLARSQTQSAPDRALYTALAQKFAAASGDLPRSAPRKLPITVGVGEAFTTTLTVCFYFALLLTLPVLLYEAYAFVIPALSSRERRIALPIMLAAPVLFAIGVVFTFLVVMPPAVRFLQGYNSNNFDNLVQAKPLYSFELLTMAAIGLTFQMPIGLLGLQRAGIINGSTLTRHWRYSVVAIAVIAAALPGADPVTTLLETTPLVILFLISIVLLKFADRRDAKRALADLTTVDEPAELDHGLPTEVQTVPVAATDEHEHVAATDEHEPRPAHRDGEEIE